MSIRMTATDPERRITFEPEGAIPMLRRGEDLGVRAGTGQQMRERIILEHLEGLYATEPALLQPAKERR